MPDDIVASLILVATLPASGPTFHIFTASISWAVSWMNSPDGALMSVHWHSGREVQSHGASDGQVAFQTQKEVVRVLQAYFRAVRERMELYHTYIICGRLRTEHVSRTVTVSGCTSNFKR